MWHLAVGRVDQAIDFGADDAFDEVGQIGVEPGFEHRAEFFADDVFDGGAAAGDGDAALTVQGARAVQPSELMVH